MVRVGYRGNPGIVEDGCAFLKTDAMLFEIALRLFIIPFKFGVFHDGCLFELYSYAQDVAERMLEKSGSGKLEIDTLGSGKDIAIHHAKEALRLAHCDDGPPYYYKVAYEEAERMLERMKAEG